MIMTLKRNAPAALQGMRRAASRWRIVGLVAAAALCNSVAAFAQVTRPDDLIEKLSTEILADIKADAAIQSGDVGTVLGLVESKIMPHVDARRMTASAVGRYWRQASPDQQSRLQDEFTRLVIRTYAGALTQVKDQTIRVKPLRSAPADLQVVVKTEVRGRGDPVQLDYRLIKTPAGWKIYDVNVLGVWLMQNYRSSFAHSIGQGGIDALIAELVTKNLPQDKR
ncbi:MAG: ABC transporter substrate-binding protein [Burkholderiaceae bacterium]